MNYHHYSEEPCDVIIEAGGVYFPVHQQAMLDLSPTFFSELFSKGPTEFLVYTVHNVSVNIMRSIIQYAYSKQINITRRNVKDLLAAAEYLSGNIATVPSKEARYTEAADLTMVHVGCSNVLQVFTEPELYSIFKKTGYSKPTSQQKSTKTQNRGQERAEQE
ncbi:hypothetical protein KOW79_002633 [Hemibagrus wyckioides]|uniref:BTB domain-containing protein n=1 Tax=Hemibagrus wyckioides TaxID=337641 RepID=A0A9D3P435_9TELE|nr:hypothetical protein KOW79_002633 [Hemibagrus wyckioides]